MKRALKYILTAVLIWIAAFVCRLLAKTYLISESRELISGILELTYVKNSGAAYGIFAGKTALLIAVTILIILGIIVYLVKFSEKISGFERTSLVLILAGGAANLYERLVYKFVVDYINIHILPVFNVADICVTTGCILLIICVLFEKK